MSLKIPHDTMRYFLVFIICLLTACGSALPTVKPYKMEIQQGNVVTSKMLLQLRPGMTKSQVRFIMGTPLVVDSFHKNRWDYFYQLRQAGKIVEQRRVILEFEKDLLARVRGDVIPAGSQPAENAADANANKTIEVAPTKPKEKSWAEKLKFWKKDEAPADAAKPKTELEAKPEPKAAPAPEAVMEPTKEAPAAEVPSVLAVPVTPGGEQPSAETPVEAPKAVEPKVETPPAEPAKAEPMKVEPPKPELTPAAEPAKPAPAPAVVEPETPVVPPSEDERLIFRMDRTLRTPAVEPPPPAPVEVPKAPAKKIEPPPQEEGPGYFERILEQIGF